MRSVTKKHTLSGGWDKITITDPNGEEVHYGSLEMSFATDIIIRGAAGQEEIPIAADMSPMTITGASNNGFPLEIKGTGDLFFITLN